MIDTQRHILYCPFTGLGLYDGFRGDEWLRNRLTIFKQFVIPSLVAQTNRQFYLWISWRAQEESSLLVKELGRTLDQVKGMKYIFTFNGLCFWDDKYDDLTASQRLMGSLSASLPRLVKVVGEVEWVYLTIQPSDDMYLCDAVEKIQAVQPGRKKAMGWRQGYIMDYTTKKVAEYNPSTLPPFSTIIFPRAVFLDAQQHYQYSGPYKSHEYVADYMKKFITLPGRGFVVGTHGENISTTFNIPFRGKTLIKSEQEAVLIKTDSWFSKPLVMIKTPRIKWRERLNRLPKSVQKVIKPWYYKVPGIH